MAQSCKPHEKVLIITPFYPPNIGGAETFCYDFAKEISKVKDVRICTIDWGKNKTFKGTGIRQFLEVFPRLFPKALKAANKERFGIAYGIGLQSAAIALLTHYFFKIEHRAVLLALYNFAGQKWPLRAFAAWVLKRTPKIYVEGEAGKHDVLALGVPENQIIKFQHWCDQDIFKPPAKRNGWKLRVLFIGRPIYEKGKHIIQAVQERTKILIGMEFIYVENCRFKDLPKYYQMADVCVVPSLYLEGISRVVIESSSCGCALIASNLGALPELVNNFGIVCKPTPDDFEYFLKELYYDREKLKRLQAQSYKYAKENFNVTNAKVFL